MTGNTANNHTNRDNRLRIGTVSFFNARPLIYALEGRSDIMLQRQVPARLAKLLDNGLIEAGLVPSIDFQRSRKDWLILPFAAIGSEGEVLTVRVFSHEPPEQIESLACDTDSHTSVALAKIVWHLRYGRNLTVKPLENMCAKEPENVRTESAVLLIGDKVLPQLGQWPYETDLGAAWTELTSLPFVYAFWAVPDNTNTAEPAEILQRAAREGPANIKKIVARYAKEHGFDTQRAYRYLTENIKFDFGTRQTEALKLFYKLAYQIQLIPRQRPLRLYQSDRVTG